MSIDTRIYLAKIFIYYASAYFGMTRFYPNYGRYTQILKGIVIVLSSFFVETILQDLFIIGHFAKFLFIVGIYLSHNKTGKFNYSLLNAITFAMILNELIDIIITNSMLLDQYRQLSPLSSTEVVHSVLLSIFLYVLSVILLTRTQWFRIHYVMDSYITSHLSIIFLIMTSLYYSLNTYIKDYDFAFRLSILLVLSQLIISVILFFMISHRIEDRFAKKNMENLTRYVLDLEENQLKFQKFRHDYKNMLLNIRSFLSYKDYDQLKVYLNELNLYSQQEMTTILTDYRDIIHVKNNYLKNIFLEKIFQMVRENVSFSFECKKDFIEIPMDAMDLVRAIGILMDNAIEAARETVNPMVNILITVESDMTEIIIENNMIEQTVDITQIMQANYSSKENHNGLGLSIISDVSKKYDNVFLHFENNDTYFTAKILMVSIGGHNV